MLPSQHSRLEVKPNKISAITAFVIITSPPLIRHRCAASSLRIISVVVGLALPPINPVWSQTADYVFSPYPFYILEPHHARSSRSAVDDNRTPRCRDLAGVAFHRCVYGDGYRRRGAAAHRRDHRVCFAEDRTESLLDSAPKARARNSSACANSCRPVA